MIVIPIAGTSVDWSELLVSCKQALGRSVTTGLDLVGMKPNTLQAYIAVLGELREAGSRPHQILSAPGLLTDHGFCSFLVAGSIDLFFAIMEGTPLDILSSESTIRGTRLGVVSGTLTKWRTAIINGTSETSSFELRLFMDKCLLLFEQQGLSQLWSAYQKRTIPDSTFSLVLKK